MLPIGIIQKPQKSPNGGLNLGISMRDFMVPTGSVDDKNGSLSYPYR